MVRTVLYNSMRKESSCVCSVLGAQHHKWLNASKLLLCCKQHK